MTCFVRQDRNCQCCENNKISDFEERKFYIHQAFVQHWDSRTLKIKIKNNVNKCVNEQNFKFYDTQTL